MAYCSVRFLEGLRDVLPTERKKKEKRGRFLLRNRYAVREECRGHTVVYLNIFAIFLWWHHLYFKMVLCPLERGECLQRLFAIKIVLVLLPTILRLYLHPCLLWWFNVNRSILLCSCAWRCATVRSLSNKWRKHYSAITVIQNGNQSTYAHEPFP